MMENNNNNNNKIDDFIDNISNEITTSKRLKAGYGYAKKLLIFLGVIAIIIVLGAIVGNNFDKVTNMFGFKKSENKAYSPNVDAIQAMVRGNYDMSEHDECVNLHKDIMNRYNQLSQFSTSYEKEALISDFTTLKDNCSQYPSITFGIDGFIYTLKR